MKFSIISAILLAPFLGAEPLTLMIEAASEKSLPVGVDVDLNADALDEDQVEVTISSLSAFGIEESTETTLSGVLEIWLGGELASELPVARLDDWGVSTFSFRLSRSMLVEAEFYLSSYFAGSPDSAPEGMEIIRIHLGGFPIRSSVSEEN